MARINLLPWREELRKQKQQDFVAALLSAIGVTAAAMLYVHTHFAGQIENQQQRNKYLTSEITVLDTRIKEIKGLEDKKDKLIAKMDVIQKLQGSRPEIVHLFDEMAATIPDGVYLTDFKQSGSKLTVKGAAQSNARVSAYMRSLAASPWLAKPKLSVIETKSKSKYSRVSNFSLFVEQTNEDAKKKSGGKS